MDDLKDRLVKCFESVFPDMPVDEIPNASQSTVANWDSIAAITLINVIEEEFSITMDLEMAGDLDSFPKVLDYLKTVVK